MFCYIMWFYFQEKLIKMFSTQLVTKLKIRSVDVKLPSLTQWLQVVGLTNNSIQCLCQKISSVEELQEKSEQELKNILTEKGAKSEEINKLCRALHNLKWYTGNYIKSIIYFHNTSHIIQ